MEPESTMLDKDKLIGGRYLLQEPLGTGSIGEVYCAIDRFTNTTVALKCVMSALEAWPGDGTSDSGTLPRLALAREFQALASMRHPNIIISVLDYGFDDASRPYITMELLDTPRTIPDAAQGQPLQTKLGLIIQVLRALTYMHRRGIIHRDLKPSNIQIVTSTDDPAQLQIKVLDFGVATTRTEIQDGEYLSGTLAYLAPEILTGSPATEASDLYAVGIILYELLRGQHPFGMRNGGWLVQQILHAEPDIVALDRGIGYQRDD